MAARNPLVLISGALRELPAGDTVNGVGTAVQPHFGRNNVSAVQPNGNGLVLSSVGMVLSAVGVATAANVATTNRYTRMKKVEYLVAVAAPTAIAGFWSGAAQHTVGAATAGDGGFHYVCRWGPATGVAFATARAFCGMGPNTAPTDVNPSTVANQFGMGWDSADTNVQIFHRGAGAVTKIDLGASFPRITVERSVAYELALFSPPGATQSVAYEVTNLMSGAKATGTVTTNLPLTTVLLSPRCWRSAGGTSSVMGVALMGLYLDTPY